VRFPREWFGPPEELVPFGPSARARDREPLDPSSPEPAAPPPDFWGEGSAMLQEVIEVPRQPQRAPGASETELGDASRAMEPAAPRPRRRRTLLAGGAILASAVAAATVLGTATSGQVNLHRKLLSIASVPSRVSTASQRQEARTARSTIRRTPKRPAEHPTRARPAVTAAPMQAAPSTPVSASSGSSSTRLSSPTNVASTQGTPRPSYDSAPVSSHTASSGTQSGGAFTLGGP
jgi:hypothetical protein